MRLSVIKVNKDLLETGLYSCTSLKIIKPMVKMTVAVVIGQGEKNTNFSVLTLSLSSIVVVLPHGSITTWLYYHMGCITT